MRILDCKILAESILDEVGRSSEALIKSGHRAPAIAVIIVGEDGASKTYVKNKAKTAERVGFRSVQYSLSEDVSEREIISLIDEINVDDSIDALLVQLPLPNKYSEKNIIERISFKKDVDGFTPYNAGLLSRGEDCFVPCTPLGIISLLKYYSIPTAGKNVTIIGRSNIVGKPLMSIMSGKGTDATVTLCNSKTENLRSHTIDADIVVVATGNVNTIDSSYVKDGSVVIDVGINRIPDSERKSGYRLVGDVDFDSLKDRDVSVTPVPGGIGLLTVAMLMKNTLKAALSK